MLVGVLTRLVAELEWSSATVEGLVYADDFCRCNKDQ